MADLGSIGIGAPIAQESPAAAPAGGVSAIGSILRVGLMLGTFLRTPVSVAIPPAEMR